MLPYKSIQEAETALGRALATTETVWFNYSGDKSDFFLYCHVIPLLILTFSMAQLFYIFLELFFHKQIKIYKIQPNVNISYSEAFRRYRDVVCMLVIVFAPVQILSWPLFKMIGIRTSLSLPSWGELVAQLIVYFLVEDYMNYWFHRFVHCEWAYDKFHKVHHEYTAPIGLDAAYAHWADLLIGGSSMILGPAMVPGHMLTWWLWVALKVIQSIEVHCGYDFPWGPTKFIPFYGGSEHHHYHHYIGGQSRNNFAMTFTYCDYIYGTDKGYRYKKRLLQQLKDEVKASEQQNGGSAGDLKHD